MSVFNAKYVDITQQHMFLGEPVNLSRNDIQKHKVFENLTEKQISFFWVPEKITLTEDRKQFKELTPNEQHIFISNLKFQSLLDSVQGRSPCMTFLSLCSLPELENFIIAWSFFETIHSRSYTHIMQNVFPNPTVVFDDIPVNKEIIARASTISKYYDQLIELTHQYKLGLLKDLRELKKSLFLTLVSVNVLEGIRFYVSFACSFAFMEGKKVMEGNAKIIQYIAADEAIHLSATQHMINIIQRGKDDQELYEISQECQPEVIEIFKSAVEQEKAWAKYLFKDGSILGLNEEILCQYVEYLCNQRLHAIGYDLLFPKQKSNPIPWITSWLSKSSRSPAPQESEIISYTVGQVLQDDGDISDIII